jgi:hypothetical protein
MAILIKRAKPQLRPNSSSVSTRLLFKKIKKVRKDERKEEGGKKEREKEKRKMHLITAIVIVYATLAANAAPVNNTTEIVCGQNKYTIAQIQSASDAACNHMEDGTTVGSSSYPHQYRNLEGFDFAVSGPYYEFPVKKGGVYKGGKCLKQLQQQ